MHFWGLEWRSGPFLTHKLLSRQDSTALLTHTHTNMTDCGTWIVDSNWSLTCFWQGVCSLFNQNQHAHTSPDLRGHTFLFLLVFFFVVPLSLSLSLSLFRPYIQSAHWCLFLFISPSLEARQMLLAFVVRNLYLPKRRVSEWHGRGLLSPASRQRSSLRLPKEAPLAHAHPPPRFLSSRHIQLQVRSPGWGGDSCSASHWVHSNSDSNPTHSPTYINIFVAFIP